MTDIPHVGSSTSVTFAKTNPNLVYPSLVQPSVQSIDRQQKPAEKLAAPSEVEHGVDSTWSWVICVAAFGVNLLVVGIHHVYAIFFLAFIKDFKVSGATAAWVGSLGSGLILMFGPLSSFITNRYGHRVSAILGSIIAGLGLFLSTLITQFSSIFWTYSLLFGLGTSLCHIPAMCICSLHFNRYISFASGIVSSGSSFGTLLLTPSMQFLVDSYGWRLALKVCSGIAWAAALCAQVFKPREKKKPASDSAKSDKVVITVDCSLFKNRIFQLWCMTTSLTAFGFFVPFVHLIPHAADLGIPISQRTILPMCIAGCTTTGRLLFGRVADCPCIHRPLLFQAAIAVIGLATLLMPFAKDLPWLLVYAIVSGLADGCFAVLLPVLTFQLLGPESAAFAWGYMVAFNSVTFILGPVVAGLLRDRLGNYNVAFHLAGAFILLGALSTIFLPWATRVEAEKGRQKRLGQIHRGAGEEVDFGVADIPSVERIPLMQTQSRPIPSGLHDSTRFRNPLQLATRSDCLVMSAIPVPMKHERGSDTRSLNRRSSQESPFTRQTTKDLPALEVASLSSVGTLPVEFFHTQSLPTHAMSGYLLRCAESSDRGTLLGNVSDGTESSHLPQDVTSVASNCDIVLYVLTPVSRTGSLPAEIHQNKDTKEDDSQEIDSIAEGDACISSLSLTSKATKAKDSTTTLPEEVEGISSQGLAASSVAGQSADDSISETTHHAQGPVVIFVAPPEIGQAIEEGRGKINIQIVANPVPGLSETTAAPNDICTHSVPSHSKILYSIKEESGSEEEVHPAHARLTPLGEGSHLPEHSAAVDAAAAAGVELTAIATCSKEKLMENQQLRSLEDAVNPIE